MKIQPDDPRLTAYALDELEEVQRLEIESLLQESPEAQAAVDEIRDAASLLRDGLANEPGDGLTEAQRESIEQLGRSPRRTRWTRLAAVASLLLAVGVSAKMILNTSTPQRLASSTRPSELITVVDTPQSSKSGIKAVGHGFRLESSGDTTMDITDAATQRMLAALGYTHAPELSGRRSGGRRGAQRVDFSPGVRANQGRALPGGMPARGYQSAYNYSRGDTWGADDSSDQPGLTGQESYESAADNSLVCVNQEPLSTFSIDVDTASYANIRRFINQGLLPPRDAVRIEEMINYFNYDYPPPNGDDPFSVNVEVATCPWRPQHRLMRIGLKGRTFEDDIRPPCNLVFLIDVSGSMSPRNKLPLLRKALGLLTAALHEDDQVAIVVYAGSSGLVLPSTSGQDKQAIARALDNLKAGGSTNGGAGIELAYRVAMTTSSKAASTESSWRPTATSTSVSPIRETWSI